MTSIIIFGDSIGEGFYDSQQGGWVARLARHFNTPNYKLNIYNASISGESTREVLLRFDIEYQSRKSEIIIFALGTNDSWYFYNDKNKPNVSVENFRKNMNQLVAKTNAKIVLMGAPNVDESKVKPVPWRKDIFYDNENIQEYNTVLKEIAQQHKVHFVETFGLLQPGDLDDGLHPNAEGHQKIFELIKSDIDQNKILTQNN